MTNFVKLVILVLIAAAIAGAQTFSFGLKGGVPLTNGFSDFTSHAGGTITQTLSTSKEYVIGPTAELHLPLGFSVEADALYRPLNLTLNAQGIPPPPLPSGNESSWEFPILGKYRFAFPIVKPYIEAGPSFRAKSSEISWLSSRGFTAGAGVELKLGRLRVGPELRYTHWGSDAPPSAAVLFNPLSSTNQAEFLVGISF
jgi:Outer membrane protein beta-barrel domain